MGEEPKRKLAMIVDQLGVEATLRRHVDVAR
jgi:hypothetical protein